jgi:hypothetical protein
MTVHSLALYKSRRQLLEERLQEIIDLLDLIDGDADLEPLLSWPEAGPHAVRPVDGDHDGETEDEREPNGDEGDFDGGEGDGPGFIGGGLGL